MKNDNALCVSVALQNVRGNEALGDPLQGKATARIKKYTFQTKESLDVLNGEGDAQSVGSASSILGGLVESYVGRQRNRRPLSPQQVLRQPSDCEAAIRSRHQKGASKAATIFLLTVIGLLVHVGFRISPIFYSYFELHNQMSSLIRVADELKDSEIRKRIEDQLKSLKIPADISDVRIERRAQTMLLSLDYVEILTLGFGDYKFDVWKFNFLCKVEDVIPQR